MAVHWFDLHHGDLTVAQLYDALALRCEVFVVEQECAYLDVDGLDLTGPTRHVLGYDGDLLVSYARVLDGPRIGRVIVSAHARGHGVARELMQRALSSCERHWPGADVVLCAQSHLVGFYGSLGFTAEGDGYEEDGIPHQDMRLTRTISGTTSGSISGPRRQA